MNVTNLDSISEFRVLTNNFDIAPRCNVKRSIACTTMHGHV